LLVVAGLAFLTRCLVKGTLLGLSCLIKGTARGVSLVVTVSVFLVGCLGKGTFCILVSTPAVGGLWFVVSALFFLSGCPVKGAFRFLVTTALSCLRDVALGLFSCFCVVAASISVTANEKNTDQSPPSAARKSTSLTGGSMKNNKQRRAHAAVVAGLRDLPDGTPVPYTAEVAAASKKMMMKKKSVCSTGPRTGRPAARRQRKRE